MASGLMAAVDLTTTAVTEIFVSPAGAVCSISVAATNRSATDSAKVSFALTNGQVPTDANWIEFNTTIEPSGVLERNGIVVGAGQKVFAKTDKTGVNVLVFGYEGT